MDAWQRVCFNYYFKECSDESKKEADAAMEWYERRKNVGCKETDDMVILPMYTDLPNDFISLYQKLEEIPESELTRQKDATRGHFHSQVNQKHYALFMELISSSRGTIALSETAQIQKLCDFTKTYGHKVGSHPFLHGLQQYFTRHLTSDFIFDWQMQDGIFIESGGASFCTDAVALCQQLELNPTSDCVVSSTTGDFVRVWRLKNERVSNSHLKKLVAALPKTFETHYHGTFIPNKSILRTCSSALDGGVLVENSFWSKVTSYCVIL